jgi:hypothetical protein
MNRSIAMLVKKTNPHERESDFAYWQTQSYQASLDALEEILREFHVWNPSTQKDESRAPSEVETATAT